MESAKGSISFPVSDTCFNLRAKYPSKRSENSIMMKRTHKNTMVNVAEVPNHSGEKKTRKKMGESTILTVVIKSDSVIAN